MSLFSFGSKKKIKLGIDIGTAALKIVEISTEDGRFSLTNYGMFELEPGSVAMNANSQDPKVSAGLSNDDIVWAIKEVIRKADMKTKDTVASIPSFPTFATTITLPYLSEDELAKSIPFEARKYIPIPLTDVQLDWAVINVTKPGAAPSGGATTATPSVEVFIIAVPKDQIKRYQEIMKNAGLNLAALELENFALVRSLIGNDKEPAAIVNVGGRSTSIVLVDGGYQRITRDFEIGSFEITKAAARSLGVSMRRAEELKKEMGFTAGDTNIVRPAMVSLVDLIVFETNKVLHNYEDQKKIKVNKVLLVGGMSNTAHFSAYFQEKLGRPVERGNSLARVIIPEGLESLRAMICSHFSVALGLGMREIK